LLYLFPDNPLVPIYGHSVGNPASTSSIAAMMSP
jgi:hypothetical protein